MATKSSPVCRLFVAGLFFLALFIFGKKKNCGTLICGHTSQCSDCNTKSGPYSQKRLALNIFVREYLSQSRSGTYHLRSWLTDGKMHLRNISFLNSIPEQPHAAAMHCVLCNAPRKPPMFCCLRRN